MFSKQLGLFDKNPHCPFNGLFEDDDERCYSHSESSGYDEISEDRNDFGGWMSDVGGVLFDEIIPQPTPEIVLPRFIPAITRSGKKLIGKNHYQFLAVTLKTVVSLKLLKVKINIRDFFGIGPETKLILLSYGQDELIENIWPHRWEIYSKLLDLGFDLVTSINYSIWFSQNHAEHLINVKRNLLTFSEMQKVGIPAIPNIYWYGRKDLGRWADWFNANQVVKIAAINLQTLRSGHGWWSTIEELTYFSSLLKNNISFIVNGPTTIARMADVKNIFPNIIFINKYCSNMAASGMELFQDSGKIASRYSPASRSKLLRVNTNLYKKLSKYSQGTQTLSLN